jgi:hypothetical protein
MRRFVPVVALFLLAACGDADIESAKQQAADWGGQAIGAATDVVDTRTACMLAGQSEAFCGCVQTRLGSDLTREHVESLTDVIGRAASGEGLEAAAEGVSSADPAVRDAIVQCATNAAVQGALGEGEN